MKSRVKSIIICTVILIAIFAYSLRFNYVNSLFPQGTLTTVSIGETVELHGVQYKAVSGEILTGNEYSKIYNDDSFEPTDKLFVAFFEVINKTNKPQKIGASNIIARCGLWANGVDYNALWYLNDDFDDVVEGNSRSKIGVVTVLNSKSLNKEKGNWSIEISRWPNRIDLLVPMNGGIT